MWSNLFEYASFERPRHWMNESVKKYENKIVMLHFMVIDIDKRAAKKWSCIPQYYQFWYFRISYVSVGVFFVYKNKHMRLIKTQKSFWLILASCSSTIACSFLGMKCPTPLDFCFSKPFQLLHWNVLSISDFTISIN